MGVLGKRQGRVEGVSGIEPGLVSARFESLQGLRLMSPSGQRVVIRRVFPDPDIAARIRKHCKDVLLIVVEGLGEQGLARPVLQPPSR